MKKKGEKEIRMSTYEEREFLKLKLSREDKEWDYDRNEVIFHREPSDTCFFRVFDEDDGFPTEMQREKREKEYERKLFEYLEKEDRKNR